MLVEIIYNKIACIFPSIEVLLRQLFWHNVDLLTRFKPKFRSKKNKSIVSLNFDQVLEVLKEYGVKEGSLLIVHSSYNSLEGSGLSPNEIIDALLNLIGPEGTLAMPVIRQYKEQHKKGKEYLTYDMEDIMCTYNVQRSLIITGFLPYYLMARKNSVTSRHPLNPMTAVGPLSQPMIERNLDGEKPSPHGPNSSWKYCFDHNALVVGLGIDLAHYLTITHVAEEAFSDWPVKERDWYRERKFRIIDKNVEQTITVKERRPKWGTLYYAERNLKKLIIEKNILHTKNINNIEVSLLESQKYITCLRSMNKKGFPYVIPKKYLEC
jgi:aminoglycoside 3-N-acetyltransferase